jgi:hypothetical protein
MRDTKKSETYEESMANGDALLADLDYLEELDFDCKTMASECKAIEQQIIRGE